VTVAQVFATEFLKLRRSKVTWLSFVVLTLGPLGVALLMWIVQDPDRAARLGLLGQKADLSGLTATWPSFFSMMTTLVGTAGLLMLAFIVAYLFGREYTEGTAKNLLALPVGRHWFVLAKFVVAAVWWVALTVVVVAEAFVVGFALRLPEFSGALAMTSVGHTLLAAGIAYLLAPVVAWIAALGRGYLAPLGFALVMLMLGNLLGKTGWAIWFPWSIVPRLVGSLGGSVETPALGSLLVVAVVFLAGIGATIAQVRYADNTQ
jgi:ABC-type transport system involved in multi-copper enzyme maturation permease subunit